MSILARRSGTAFGTLLLLMLAAAPGLAAEIIVFSSGGLTAPMRALAPAFEARSGHKVRLVLGPSMGTSHEAIPNRLQRGETADVVLMVGYALADLVAAGRVIPESRKDIADSKIALAVREGAPKPDIGTLEAFKRALLQARSIAYSDSASGVYIESEMYKRLGLEDELKGKSRKIVADPVGGVVARGDAEIGFQQLSELLPVKGITVVGFIPDEVQKVTVFSAGIPSASREMEAAKSLIDFMGSADGADTIRKAGLEPLGPAH